MSIIKLKTKDSKVIDLKLVLGGLNLYHSNQNNNMETHLNMGEFMIDGVRLATLVFIDHNPYVTFNRHTRFYRKLLCNYLVPAGVMVLEENSTFAENNNLNAI